MGSSGSSRISDYPGSAGGKPGGGDGSGGGADDRCARAFNTVLEDVEHSDYYVKNGAVPPVGTELTIVARKRIIAVTKGGESVGNLPTSFNYLAASLKDGWTYFGVIRNATNPPPIANIAADFVAAAP
jgi:hypothetical protein